MRPYEMERFYRLVFPSASSMLPKPLCCELNLYAAQLNLRLVFPSTSGMPEEVRRKEIASLREEWAMRLELTQPSMGEREPKPLCN